MTEGVSMSGRPFGLALTLRDTQCYQYVAKAVGRNTKETDEGEMR